MKTTNESINYMIQLGDKVRDRVSGFTGIAVCRSRWLSGCERISIQAPALKDGKIPDLQSFDEDCIEIIKEGVAKVVKPATTGGPRPTPTR